MNGLSRTSFLRKKHNNLNDFRQFRRSAKSKSQCPQPLFAALPWLLMMPLLLLGQFVANARADLPSQYDSLPLIVAKPINNIMGYVGEDPVAIDLLAYFDMNGEGEPAFELALNTFPEVAYASVDNHVITIDLLEPGQTNIKILATYQDAEAELAFAIGAMPLIDGDAERVDFSNLIMDAESFWNGSDASGGFESGSVIFPNTHNPEWGAWSGWAYSNVSDNTTPGWLNQYSAITGAAITGAAITDAAIKGAAITGAAINGEEDNPGVYALSYVAWPGTVMKFNNSASHEIKGIFVTNTTYAALSMLHGDDFSKKFGGDSGDDPDWFMLTITGIRNGEETGIVDYYLADYRFEDNSKDYVIQTWQWVELGSLGKVDSLVYTLSSSDMGDWGMNTPAYFALGKIVVVPDIPSLVSNPIDDITPNVYPNPTAGQLHVVHPGSSEAVLTVFNTSGQVAYRKQIHPGTTSLDITDFRPGVYLVRIHNDVESGVTRIIKR